MTVQKISSFEQMKSFVESSERYRFDTYSDGETDHRRVWCRDCSTRTTGVVIGSASIEEHESWHEQLQSIIDEPVKVQR